MSDQLLQWKEGYRVKGLPFCCGSLEAAESVQKPRVWLEMDMQSSQATGRVKAPPEPPLVLLLLPPTVTASLSLELSTGCRGGSHDSGYCQRGTKLTQCGFEEHYI